MYLHDRLNAEVALQFQLLGLMEAQVNQAQKKPSE